MKLSRVYLWSMVKMPPQVEAKRMNGLRKHVRMSFVLLYINLSLGVVCLRIP